VLLFVDAFVRAADERGYAFAPRGSDFEPGMLIVIKSEKVQFSIFEESHRVMPTRPKGRSRSSSAPQRIECRPSGRFCFRIREVLSGCHEPTFFDRPEHPLESQLSAILRGLCTAASELRERSEKRETERRAEEERAQQHRLAEARVRRLHDHLDVWTKAEALYRLIAHVERRMESEASAELSYAREWLEWARAEATSLDPTSGSMDEFFDHYRSKNRSMLPDNFDDGL
jgi:hypothetical protein